MRVEAWIVDVTRREAFEEFFEAEADGLRRLAFFLTGNQEQAADLAQEALARVYRRWDRVAELESPALYARMSVVNLCRSAWRRRLLERRRPVQRPAEDLDGHAASVAEAVRTIEALRTLPQAQRAAIVLRYYEDRPVAEVARILGRPEGTVKSDLHRALARLRPLLEEENP